MMSAAVPCRGSRPTRARWAGFQRNGKRWPASTARIEKVTGRSSTTDEARRDRAIVDAGAVLDRDRHVAHDPAGGRDDDVAHAVPDAAVVGDGMCLAGLRVAVRVPGEGAGERSVERIVALRLQVLGQRDGVAAGLDHGEGAAADLDDVGVDGVVAPARPRGGGPAERRGRRTRADPAVAVPQGLAALDAETVHHAVAQEPVVAARRRAGGVGAHLEVAAVEPRRDRPGHGQVPQGQLLAHRRVDADHEGVLRPRKAQPVAGRHQRDKALGGGTQAGLDQVRHRALARGGRRESEGPRDGGVPVAGQG